MQSSRVLRSVVIARTDVSEEEAHIAFLCSVRWLLVTANVFSYFTDSSHTDDGGVRLLRNVGFHKSQTVYRMYVLYDQSSVRIFSVNVRHN
jgi:hypothetical protein